MAALPRDAGGHPPAGPALTTRTRLLGGVALLAYLVACVATLRLTGHHVRPLFEGIGPPPVYRWVDPPPEFKVGNVPPEGARRELPLGEKGSSLSSLPSGDAQAVVNLPEGAVPAKAGDTVAVVEFDPLAPRGLGPVPAGLEADGNVYRVTISYGPSGQAVPTVAKPGNFVMSLPHGGVAILWSADGKQWQRLPTQEVGAPTTLGVQFERAGYYLGASTPIPPAQKKNDIGTVILLVAIVGGLALALGFLPVLFHRVVSGRAAEEKPTAKLSARSQNTPATGRPRPKRRKRKKQ